MVAAAAGVFALAGGTVARRVLGSSYGGGTGAELGRLVVYLAPWMVASVAVTVAYPLLFVRGRARWLPLLAVGALARARARRVGRARGFGLAGVAGGLARDDGASCSPSLLAALGALAPTLRGARRSPRSSAAASRRSRSACRAASLGPLAAAVVGLVAVRAVLGVGRPPGLRHAWAYLHSLQ